MEAPEFFVERQFLEGNISPNDYLSYIASLSGDYAYIIRALRNVQAIDPEGSYQMFLDRLATMPRMAQQVLASGNMERYEGMVKSVRDYILRAINAYYQEIEKGSQMEQGASMRYGRES